ncbi:MAG: hypothetical protein MJY48_04645 [Bacteroidales bacterium]|nr:hypothetical protein [Bacteroidales bacterium]
MNKRFLLILLAAALLSGNAAAQETAFPVNCTDGSFKVQYAVDKESSVLLLCRYIPNAVTEGPAPYTKNVNRKIHVSTPDGDYALLNTCQIPVMNEADAKFAYLKGEQPALNFSLEFEKFPLDEPFDLVEDGSDPSSFTVKGLTVNREEPANVNADSFLKDTPYYEFGYRYEDGEPIYYFDEKDVLLQSTAWPHNYEDRYFLSVGFRIVNRSSSPIPVKFKDFSAQAQRLNKKNEPVKCNLTICDAKKANSEWKDADLLEMEHQIPTTTQDAASNTLLTASQATSGALGGAFALGWLIVNAVDDPEKEPYMREKNKIREEQMELYLKDTTIQPGDTLSTFVTIKYAKSPSSTNVSFCLNGDKYDMKY